MRGDRSKLVSLGERWEVALTVFVARRSPRLLGWRLARWTLRDLLDDLAKHVGINRWREGAFLVLWVGPCVLDGFEEDVGNVVVAAYAVPVTKADSGVAAKAVVLVTACRAARVNLQEGKPRVVLGRRAKEVGVPTEKRAVGTRH